MNLIELFQSWYYVPTIDAMQAQMLREVWARTRQYSFTVAVDDSGPLHCRIVNGKLPRGLRMFPSGMLVGTPTGNGGQGGNWSATIGNGGRGGGGGPHDGKSTGYGMPEWWPIGLPHYSATANGGTRKEIKYK